MLLPIAATSGLCVEMTIDCSKSLFIFKNSFIKSKEFNLSKLPVGSSAKIILGLLITARKVATRDLSPPDNWLGYWFSNPI